MRKLIYCLADGHKVDSLTKAKESGQTYTVTCEVIPEPVHITEKQKARRIKIQVAIPKHKKRLEVLYNE